MSFIFPAKTRHLPNDDQLNLLFNLVQGESFPGFLHTSVLNLTRRDEKNTVPMTTKMLTQTLRGSLTATQYLFMPFSIPITYIMEGHYNVSGFVTHPNLGTYWLEDTVSLAEIHTAMKMKIPLVVRYANIGYSVLCDMCRGHRALDWVDNFIVPHEHNEIPMERYILVQHRFKNFLIDNQRIQQYKKNILYPCPKCFGMGCSGVLMKVELQLLPNGKEKSIQLYNFESEDYEDRLEVVCGRKSLLC